MAEDDIVQRIVLEADTDQAEQDVNNFAQQVSDLFDKMGQSGETAGDAFTKIDEAAKEAGQSLEQVGQASGQLDDSLAKVGDAVDQVDQSLAKIGETGLSKISDSAGEVSDSLAKAGDAADQVEESLSKIGETGLAKISEAAGEVGDSLGKAGDAADQVEEAISKIGDSGLSKISDAAAEVGDSLEKAGEAATQAEEAISKIGDSADGMAKIGEAAKEADQGFQDLSSSAEEAYSSVGQSANDGKESVEGAAEGISSAGEKGSKSLHDLGDAADEAGHHHSESAELIKEGSNQIAEAFENLAKGAHGSFGGIIEMVTELAEKMGPAGIAAAALGTALIGSATAMFEVVEGAAQVNAQMERIAAVTGSSVTEVYGMTAALGAMGVSTDGLASSLSRFSRTMASEIPKIAKDLAEAPIKAEEANLRLAESQAKAAAGGQKLSAEMENEFQRRQAIIDVTKAQDQAMRDQANDLQTVMGVVERLASGEKVAFDTMTSVAKQTEAIAAVLQKIPAQMGETTDEFGRTNLQIAKLIDILRDIPDPAQRAALATRELGRGFDPILLKQSGDEFLRIQTELKALAAIPIESETEKLEQFHIAANQLSSVMENLRQRFAAALSPVFTEMLKSIFDYVKTLGPAVADFGKELSDLFTSVGAVIRDLMPILKLFGEVLLLILHNIIGNITIIADILTGRWKEAWQAAQDLTKRNVDSMVNIWKTMNEPIDLTGKKITETMEKATDSAVKDVEKIPRATEKAAAETGSFWQRFAQSADQIFANIGAAATAFGQQVSQSFQNMVQSITQAFQSAYQFIDSTFIQPTIQGISRLIQSIQQSLQQISQVVQQAFSAAYQFVDTTFVQPVIQALSRLVQSIEQIFQQVSAAVREAFSAAYQFIDSTFIQPAIQAFNRLVQSIEQILQQIESAVKEAFSAAIEFVKTTFIDPAVKLFQDFVKGIEDAFKSVTDAVSSAFQDMLAPISAVIDQVMSWINQLIQLAEDAWAAISGLGGGGGGESGGLYAEGGLVGGRAGVDANPAWLTRGEYVVNAAAVQHWGVNFMQMINSMQAPRFAAGGLNISSASPSAGVSGSGPGASTGQRTLHLTIEGRSFSGLTVPETTAKSLEKFAVHSQIARTGVNQSWRR